MNPNQALWEQGDFTRIAATMRASGAALVRAAGIGAGTKVLDLGCGDGTTALPAAQLGAEVLGIDISTPLVAAANRRAREAGVADRLQVLHGDACALAGIEDESFDRVVSIFGAMFAPRPFDVAREMVRVARPGGRIVMGNWIPDDSTMVAQLLKISSACSPPPPEGFISPMRWGVPAQVEERFGAAGIPKEAIACDKDSWVFEFAGTPAEFVDAFRLYYGPTMNAFAAAQKQGGDAQLREELVALFERENRSQSPGTTVIAANYLRVTVTKPGG